MAVRAAEALVVLAPVVAADSEAVVPVVPQVAGEIVTSAAAAEILAVVADVISAAVAEMAGAADAAVAEMADAAAREAETLAGNRPSVVKKEAPERRIARGLFYSWELVTPKKRGRVRWGC